MDKDTVTQTMQQTQTLRGQEGRDWINQTEGGSGAILFISYYIIPMDFIEVHRN
ncbi:hypothetical protein LCGC14_2004970 [marine sediment metagenome]|uniref:Uncharacterized protein n=1 Tax=marine sediment metagenome TaxID=412755 RepID=A0A0F9HFG4_9ZZZZ